MASKNSGKKILVMTDWFEPGYKAGGPIRSCVNFAEHMKAHYEIFILTGDRDLGDKEPYKEIKSDAWQEVDGIHVFYASPTRQSYASLKKIVSSIRPDFIYLNSLFSQRFTIFPIVMHWLGGLKSKLVLAPRGMLKASALNFKKTKKEIFLSVFKMGGLQKRLVWQATDKQEEQDILKKFPGARVIEAANFPARILKAAETVTKMKGSLRMVFIGRIHPIKNLDFLLTVLKDCDANIELDLIGILEDKAYWEKCQAQIATLPKAIKVNFLGEMKHDRLLTVLQRSHIFALPTTGENFGHAIFEALAAGRPVLISDQTPWRQLRQAKAGWDIPLNSSAEFRNAILAALDWDQNIFDQWSKSAWNFAENSVDSNGLMNTYEQLFS